MNLDHLTRRLYPHEMSGRRRYHLKVLAAAISVGLMMGGLLVFFMWLMTRWHK